MLIIPILAAQGQGISALPLVLAKALIVIAAVIIAGKFLIPNFFYRVLRTRNRELFLLVIVVTFLFTTWLCSLVGLSLALGAFLAGLAIADSEYSHQALAEAVPFRDIFSSLFFISVGMLIDFSYLIHHLPLLLSVSAVVFLIKFATGFIPPFFCGYTLKTSLLVAFLLISIGEFSFVLASVGLTHSLISPEQFQQFISIAAITMLLSPLVATIGESIPARFADISLNNRQKDLAPELPKMNHVIVAGYGVGGRQVVQALRSVNIDYVVLELNPSTVRDESRHGEHIIFGDCTRPPVLNEVGIRKARVFVVAISDPNLTRRAIRVARNENQDIYIIARAHYQADVDQLLSLGANEVICEEFEASIEVFTRVLEQYNIDPAEILQRAANVREKTYQFFRCSDERGGVCNWMKES